MARDVEQAEKIYEKIYGRPQSQQPPPWQWPTRDIPNFSPKAAQKIKQVIDEAEKTLTEAAAVLPKSDPVGHDQELQFLLFDFASAIYCVFLEEASHLLRRGNGALTCPAVGNGSSLTISARARVYLLAM